ncbi:MAG: hypothetical protein LBS56_07470 [Propionibacteriaceae bacterium]|jgi:hypothetical protein|nr:hypothetical protein [Propionibacteriaceae bacterium]
MTWFHAVEESQLGELMRYHAAHHEARYLVEFADGEAYIVRYATDYESDNSGDLEIELDDPRYDEFHQAALDVEEVVRGGPRRCHQGLAIDYRDSPTLIKDVDTGATVYPGPGATDS